MVQPSQNCAKRAIRCQDFNAETVWLQKALMENLPAKELQLALALLSLRFDKLPIFAL
jgi:hypothetical protein